MSKEIKRDTYISKSITKALDNLMNRLLNENNEIVIKIKIQKEEGNEAS